MQLRSVLGGDWEEIAVNIPNLERRSALCEIRSTICLRFDSTELAAFCLSIIISFYHDFRRTQQNGLFPVSRIIP